MPLTKRITLAPPLREIFSSLPSLCRYFLEIQFDTAAIGIGASYLIDASPLD